LTSTVLVVATAAAAAAVAHGLGTVGADVGSRGRVGATTVGILARGLPRRNITVLRAESLVNDGAALVVYAVAVGGTSGAEPAPPPRRPTRLQHKEQDTALRLALIGRKRATVLRLRD